MTTELTSEAIAARLDLDHLDAAAAWTARALADRGCAYVNLTPGDATCYRLIVVGPQVYWSDNEHPARGDGYMVVLTNCSGVAYPWNGQEVHPSYAASKWTTLHHQWTGVVLAEFLNRLADLLATP